MTRPAMSVWCVRHYVWDTYDYYTWDTMTRAKMSVTWDVVKNPAMSVWCVCQNTWDMYDYIWNTTHS